MAEYATEIRWAASVVMLVLMLMSGKLIRWLMGALDGRLRKVLPDGVYIVTEGLSKPLIWAVRVSLLLAVALTLPLPISRDRILQVTMPAYQAALIALGAWGFWRCAPVCRLMFKGAGEHMDWQNGQTLARFSENLFRVVVALIALLSVLERFGLPVMSLIAGAGVAGLAITLAAQSTLSNLIAGVTIVLEQPFIIGDYIILGSMEGTVEDISFRSTRLRTPDQMLVTVDNSKVLSEYIENASNRRTRLWTFNLLLTFAADRARVELFQRELTDMLRSDEQVQADTVQITLDAFGESGLDISVRLYVTAVALAEFRELKNRLNLQIMDLIVACGCELAYPTTTVHHANEPAE